MLMICGPCFEDHWSCGNLNSASVWVDWGIILQGLIVYLPLSDSLSGVWTGGRRSLRSFWWLGFSVLSGPWAHCPFHLPDWPLQVKATVCWWSSYPCHSPFHQTRKQHALADSEAAVFAPDPNLHFILETATILGWWWHEDVAWMSRAFQTCMVYWVLPLGES